MRDGPVPCRHATDYEINQGKHVTWNDNGVCNPCRRILDRFLAAGATPDEPQNIDA